ncbi:transporter [Paracoccus sp. 12-3]|nr:transporter [Paracoccus xiamenensis]
MLLRLARCTSIFLLAIPSTVAAQDKELAKQLTNPVASLVSVPFQLNHDSGYGPNDGSRIVLNVQPVIPFKINDEWNLISRTIITIVRQNDIVGSSGTQFGLGDTVQSLFLSPSKPGSNGVIWGAGVVLLLPTATEPELGGDKWGAGPTGVVLRQSGPWTYGVLANHIWSFAGSDDAADVNATFLQTFLTYTTEDSWTFALNTESTYDWESEQWSVPVNFMVNKLVNMNGQPVSFQAGIRYWADGPEGGPEGFGARAGATLLFPKSPG